MIIVRLKPNFASALMTNDELGIVRSLHWPGAPACKVGNKRRVVWRGLYYGLPTPCPLHTGTTSAGDLWEEDIE